MENTRLLLLEDGRVRENTAKSKYLTELTALSSLAIWGHFDPLSANTFVSNRLVVLNFSRPTCTVIWSFKVVLVMKKLVILINFTGAVTYGHQH